MPDRVVTVGIFDGVHLGHRKIIQKLKIVSRNRQLEPVLVTFNPHPRKYLLGKSPTLLNDLDEKVKIIKGMGIKNIQTMAFDKEISMMSAEEFISEIIFKKFSARHLVIGFNHHLGKNREGDSDIVKKITRYLGMGFSLVRPSIIDGVVVSSTYIRCLLNEGDVEKAAKLLKRFYKTGGIHTRGAGRGSKIGFPTINILTNPEMTEVGEGVYGVRIYLDSKPFLGLAFIGNSPIFSDGRKFEVFIPNWKPMEFGERIDVEFVFRLRDVLKFDSIEELRRQIQKDVEQLNTKKKAGGLKCP
ncbi:riboflavin biosynthesis protein RibF [candidate division WOR-3 bacterium]|nr:riboflavin biosynthesis protein RibF [candidate division WOR-3 bacterium]